MKELTKIEKVRFGLSQCTKPETWVKVHARQTLDNGIPDRYVK